MAQQKLDIRKPAASDWGWIIKESEEIGGPFVVSAGRLYDLREHMALAAFWDTRPAGFVIYCEAQDCLVILGIKATQKHVGVGSALLSKVEDLARERGVKNISLCTTNDNLDALRFYQRRGFHISAFRVDGIKEVLRLKGHPPGTQLRGSFGIVIRDVIELSKPVPKT